MVILTYVLPYVKQLIKDSKKFSGSGKILLNNKWNAGFLVDNCEKTSKNTAKALREYPTRFEPPKPLFKKLTFDDVSDIIDGADEILANYKWCR